MDKHSRTHLLLGRLDGRLQNSPATDLWLAKARLQGTVALAQLAGVPITQDSLLAWICGHSPPPRRSEGLNDPLSIAALFHFALQAQESAQDPIAQASLRVLRTLLDDRAEAALYAPQDLVWYGPLYTKAKRALLAPMASQGFLALAERLIDVQNQLRLSTDQDRSVFTADGRRLEIAPHTFEAVWVLGTLLPQAYVTAGLTTRALPSLVGLPTLLSEDPLHLAAALQRRVLEIVRTGANELDSLEKALLRLPNKLDVTKRSKAPILARLTLVFTDLRVPAIARLLGISSQGAAKLKHKVDTLAWN